ncbi:hypothetical protein K456DRAFT_120069 [Colletotrichum gloeosporioides 23]|nr:hypothetical protein K456DRAFT_120069 [Colletotrichum gloeosporioides 23]
MSADKATATTSAADKPLGMRKNGKQWHAPKKAFRPTSGLTSYEKRAKERVAMAAMKAKEKEMKDEKEAERKQRIQNLKDKKAAKEEKEQEGETKQAHQLMSESESNRDHLSGQKPLCAGKFFFQRRSR